MKTKIFGNKPEESINNNNIIINVAFCSGKIILFRIFKSPKNLGVNNKFIWRE